MDRNNSLYNSKEDSIEMSNIISNYKITIQIDKGKTEEIILNNKSNPEELAYNLCIKYNLEYKTLKSITKKIELLQNNYFLNSKTKYDNSSISQNNTINHKTYKNNLLTEQSKYYNHFNNTKNEQNENFIDKEDNLNNINIKEKEFNTMDKNKNSKNLYNNILVKKLESRKKKHKSKNELFLLSKEINEISNNDNSKQNNRILATNVINQTIQNCLELIENETKPFSNESSGIKKGTQSSKYYEKSEVKLGSFISNKENNKMTNKVRNNNINNKQNNDNELNFCNEVDNYNNNIDEEKIFQGKNYLRTNKFSNSLERENIYNNYDEKTIEQEREILDDNIRKMESESQDLTKNIIINDTNANTLVSSFDNNYLNHHLAISESININMPNCIRKEISFNILSSSKISFNNDININKKNNDKRYKKLISISNRCIPIYKNYVKNGSISTKNKAKNLLNLFSGASSKIKTIKSPSEIYEKYKSTKKIFSNKVKENIHTPSTNIKSCKNSLSSLTVSDKNLLLNIQKNSSKNFLLNKINNGYLLDELYNNRYSNNNLNEYSTLNKKLNNNIKRPQRFTHSVNLNNNIISEELYNENNNNCNIKEKNKYTTENNNYFQKINTSNKNNIGNYYLKMTSIKKNKGKTLSKKRLIFEENKIIDNLSYATSNTYSNHNKYLSFNNYKHITHPINSISKNIIFTHQNNNKSAFFNNNFFNNNSFNKSSINNKNKKYVELKYLTENIISKKEIENCFKNISKYICINNDYLDAFTVLNRKSIPSEIYKPVQFVIKKCNNKNRFISINEFIRKGYELFHCFSQNDKIALMNFSLFKKFF